MTTAAQVQVTEKLPKCSKHPGKETVFICVTCNNKLVCSKCATKFHQRHDLEDTEDFTKSKKKHLQEWLEYSKSVDEPFWKNLRHDVERMQTENKSESGNMQREIRKKCKEMKNYVDRAADRFLTLCKEHELQTDKIYKDFGDKLESVVADYENQITEGENAIQTNNMADIIVLEANFMPRSKVPDLPNIANIVRFSKSVHSAGMLEFPSKRALRNIFERNVYVFDNGNIHISRIENKQTKDKQNIEEIAFHGDSLRGETSMEILLDEHESFVACGNRVTFEFKTLKEDQRRKVFLFQNVLQQLEETTDPNQRLTDYMGKSLPALTVLEKMFYHFRGRMLNISSFHRVCMFILPPSFSEKSTKLLKQAAENILYEATVIYVKEQHGVLHTLKYEKVSDGDAGFLWFCKGGRYMALGPKDDRIDVSDVESTAEGDFQAHQYHREDDQCMSVIWDNFIRLLYTIFGERNVKKYCQENPEEVASMKSSVKTKFYELKEGKNITISVPYHLVKTHSGLDEPSIQTIIAKSPLRDKVSFNNFEMTIEGEVFDGFCDEAITNVRQYLDERFQSPEFKVTQIIVAYGEFLQSECICKKLKQAVTAYKLHIVKDPAIARYKGAAWWGFNAPRITQQC